MSKCAGVLCSVPWKQPTYLTAQYCFRDTVYQDPAHLHTALQRNDNTAATWLFYTPPAVYKVTNLVVSGTTVV